jgi:V/A-type H+-transporting ATPase subunit I
LVEGEEEINAIKDKYAPVFGKSKFLNQMLRILSDETIPVLRTKVISVIQGWVPEDSVNVLDRIIDGLQEKTGELFLVQYEEPSHDDHGVPTPTPKFKPSFLQPAWTLTTLRGYPSIHEVNPNYITILIFSFQFGLMFGDIGQGAIFLLLGLVLTKKYKRGLMSKLGPMFIPMGISAIIFGFLYDSIFLVEGLLFHHHQILPSPVEHTTSLMLIVFQIAVIEVVIGLIIGAINAYKSGHKWGVIGEHGLGMILYVVGLYLSAYAFMVDRSSPVFGDFMAVLGHWTFIVMVSGMVLSMLEPIISAITGGHFGIEVFGEGVGALLMTFVEGLANLFSFLRIAAFALAHASLAIAASAMSSSMGIGGLLLMNTIAMSFEFISSSVQSIRLLYYEFMGKFFHGGGSPFRPFRIRKSS